MRRYWPKSFFALVLMAMALISLPLFGVLLASDLLLDRQVRVSSALAYRSVAASQMSQALQEQLTSQERRLRQYKVLGSPQIYDEVLVIIKQINISGGHPHPAQELWPTQKIDRKPGGHHHGPSRKDPPQSG